MSDARVLGITGTFEPTAVQLLSVENICSPVIHPKYQGRSVIWPKNRRKAKYFPVWENMCLVGAEESRVDSLIDVLRVHPRSHGVMNVNITDGVYDKEVLK